MCVARPQNVQSKKFATSSCTNLAKQSEQLSVLHACGIPKKGQFTACAVSVDPLCVIKRGVRGEHHGPEDWQCHHWKAKDATKNVKKIDYTTMAKRWKDVILHIEKLNRYIDGLSSTASFWTTSRQSKSSTRPPENTNLDTTINTY